MLRRLRTFYKAHAALAVILTSLVLAGTAAAAYVIYASIVDGTATTSFSSATMTNAVTAVDTWPTIVINNTPGTPNSGTGTSQLTYNLRNNTANAESATVTGITFVSTGTGGVNCGSHISVTSGLPNTQGVPAGVGQQSGAQSAQLSVTNLPDACSGASVTASFTGTTTP
jgi:hypothetical protein